MKYRDVSRHRRPRRAKSASAPGPSPPAGGARRPTTKRSAMLRRALDEHGVTFFDAADAYGNGRAERQLAEAFRGRRDEVVIGDEGRLRHLRRSGADGSPRTAASCRCAPIRRSCAWRSTSASSGSRPTTSTCSRSTTRRWSTCATPELWDTLRELQREGKIRAWGAAFGPAIGWLYEAVELVEREPDINTIQMIWNVLEQHPGTAMIEAARRHAPNCCFNIRVTHASGMLEGKYTEDTVFPENDHRRHRPRSLAGERREEGEDARLPRARDDARPGGAQVAARRAAAS